VNGIKRNLTYEPFIREPGFYFDPAQFNFPISSFDTVFAVTVNKSGIINKENKVINAISKMTVIHPEINVNLYELASNLNQMNISSI
jgi:hypothetical protein